MKGRSRRLPWATPLPAAVAVAASLIAAVTVAASVGTAAQAPPEPPAAAPSVPLPATPPVPPPESSVLDEVLVTGERPGPGLWRITAGVHDLWILGTLEPLPKDMTWRSATVEARIAASQAVIAPPRISTDVGFFKGLTLLPSLLRARKSPDGRSLEQELPHDLYLRWLALRVKYLDNSAADEGRRPLFAALDVYLHALDAAGLTAEETVWPSVEHLARRQHVPIVPVTLEIKVPDPKSAIGELSQIPQSAEIACLEKTVERIETDLQGMRQRANQWALGDVRSLRAARYPDERIACLDAFFAVPRFKNELRTTKLRLTEAWLAAADAALAEHPSSVAVLPMNELLEADGFLARLRARGYEIQDPD